MFETLFTRPSALERHREGPLADARKRYLIKCASEGAAPATLQRVARELLVITERLDVKAGETITRHDIEVAGQRWARYQRRRGHAHGPRWSRELFVQIATAWFGFRGCLEESRNEPGAFAGQVDEFVTYVREERGLSSSTIRNLRWHVESFLDGLGSQCRSFAEVSIEAVDAFLTLKGKQGWGRVSIATSAKALRSFFRHAEMRGWCTPGIASGIDAPRLFKYEGLPSGPHWEDVERLIASASGSRPSDIRDRAILMLFAIYGLRTGEVAGLRLEDLDWTREIISVVRPKLRRTQYYPLVPTVGDAIVRYLQEARPHCARRELFLRVIAPFRPLSPGGLYNLVSRRLAALGVQTPHLGPHCLRHYLPCLTMSCNSSNALCFRQMRETR